MQIKKKQIKCNQFTLREGHLKYSDNLMSKTYIAKTAELTSIYRANMLFDQANVQ